MQRLGSTSSEMKKMKDKEILRSRLQLMVVMVKAYLKNYELGRYRAAAIRKNASRLSEGVKDWESYASAFGSENHEQGNRHLDHILFQRVKLLTIMAKSFSEGNPMGFHRKMALQNNIDYISESLKFENEAETLSLMSVA